MLLSVIIAVYNGEKYIEKALKSILSQSLTRRQYEIVVVNDGSTDNTREILKRYESEITIVNQTNHGFVWSKNKGIKQSRGKYIIYVDADDYIDNDLFILTTNLLEKYKEYDCVYTDRYEIKGDRKDRIRVGENNVFNMVACGVLFRKSIFDKIGLFDNSLLFGDDYDFMIRFFTNGLKGYYLRRPLYCYVKHDSNMTVQKQCWKDGWNQLLEKWGEDEMRKWFNIQLGVNDEEKNYNYS